MPATPVFLADDHAVVRDGLATLLDAQPDIQVVGTAANGREAIAEIRRLAPRGAILDISMPELDGIAAARQIVAASSEVQVMFLSMHAGSHHVFHALEAGERGYLL